MATGLLAESITTNLTFTAKVPLLMKATSNDEKSTQGYDLQEIANISKSSLANCKSLLNFLLGRLEKKSPHIKFKVLNLMKYLAINGHSEFRSGLRHNAEIVKKMTTFRGEVHPIHGDGLNINVREAATKLELLLFDVNNPEVGVMYQSMIAPSHSGKKMEGFGNSITPPLKKDTSLSDMLKKVKETVIMKDTKSKNKPCENEVCQGFQQLDTMKYTPIKLFTENNYHEVENTGGTVHDDKDGLKISDREQSEVDENCHYYESRIVHDITAEGGMTKTPSKEMLKEFVKKSSSLDFDVILENLNEKLGHPSSVVQLKSLCVIEYLLRCDIPNIFSSINDHCCYINNLTTSLETVIQAKANKISLTVISGMKLQQPDIKEDATIPPPSYEAAKDLPIVSSNEIEEVVRKDSTNMESLFSGMNFSCRSDDVASGDANLVTKQLQLVPDLLGEIPEGTGETTSNSATKSMKSMDIFDPLVTLESVEEKTVKSNVIVDTNDLNINISKKNNIELTKVNESHFDGVLAECGQETRETVNLWTESQPSVARNSGSFGSLVSRSNASSIPSARRPFPKDMKPEENGFAFLRKSSKKDDAFSFVSDEIAASKTKQK